jgi:hypothetical protein
VDTMLNVSATHVTAATTKVAVGLSQSAARANAAPTGIERNINAASTHSAGQPKSEASAADGVQSINSMSKYGGPCLGTQSSATIVLWGGLGILPSRIVGFMRWCQAACLRCRLGCIGYRHLSAAATDSRAK